MDYVVLIGLAGMSLILVAFILNVLKHISASSTPYLLMNTVGSGLLIWYSFLLSSIPFAILNIVWTGYAIYGLAKRNNP